jgi:HK97 gp10 family phage protein
MSDKITMHIDGLENCEAKLLSLSSRVAKSRINTALKNCAAHLALAISYATYVGKDNPKTRLKDSFILSGIHNDGYVSSIDVGPTKAKTAVAMAEELGFPTTPAHPMMRNTMDEEVPALIDIFVNILNEELENVKI